jgi:hypothetical protein
MNVNLFSPYCYTLLRSKLDMSLVSIMFLTSEQGCRTLMHMYCFARSIMSDVFSDVYVYEVVKCR